MINNTYRAVSPDYRISIDGKDITKRIDARLMSLSLTESRGNESDELSLTLDDADGLMALPPKGGTITLQLGWEGEGLVDKGSFLIDEVEHQGAPDTIAVRARAVPFAGPIKQRAEKSWHQTTLGQIAQTIAQRHKLVAKIDAALAARVIEHIDQTNESDLHFLTRLAKKADAVCSVKKGHLVMTPIGGAKTASGQALPTLRLTRQLGDQHHYQTADRDSYTAVRAYWTDGKKATRKGVVVGKVDKGLDKVKVLKDTYTTAADARAAAQAELQRITRGGAKLSLTLALGQPALAPQTPVRVSGFKAGIDDAGWLVVRVVHDINDQGFTTKIECELNALAGDMSETPEEFGEAPVEDADTDTDTDTDEE